MDFNSLMFRFLHTDGMTTLAILFWGNLTLGFMILAGLYRCECGDDARGSRWLGWSKLFQAASVALVIIVGEPMESIFLHVSVIFLLLGFFFESRVMLFVSGYNGKKLVYLQEAVCGALIFFCLFFTNGDILPIRYSHSLGSLSMFALFAIPGARFILGAGKSLVRATIGLMYLSIVPLLLIEILRPFPFFWGHHTMVFLADELIRLAFILITLVGSVGFMILLNQNANTRISELAFRDPLTGLVNRRFFSEQARLILATHAREKKELALLFLDIDHFKKVNDTYGHHFGDDVLRDFASVVKLQLRPQDLACRYGGEEFLVLLSATGTVGAAATAGRLLELFRQSKFRNQTDFHYTASCGICAHVPASATVDELQDLIARADKALYRAKENGRDRIEAFGADPDDQT